MTSQLPRFGCVFTKGVSFEGNNFILEVQLVSEYELERETIVSDSLRCLVTIETIA